MRRILFSALLVFSISFLSAQSQVQYSFIHYSTASGLISNQVNSVLQDEEGFIWTGTTDGLQRFDGTRYKTFRHSETDSTTLPSNPVWQLLLDKNKNLWLLMSDGSVGIFNRDRFTFRKITTHFKDEITPKTSSKRLISDEFGHLFYLLSGSEVITLNNQGTEFSYKNNFFKQLPGWKINDLVQQPGTHKYWLSIKAAGLVVFNQATGNLGYKTHNPEAETLVDSASANTSYYNLFFDRNNRLWDISWTSLPAIHCFDLNAGRYIVKNLTLGTTLKTYHEIKGFYQQRNGTIWVNGLLVFGVFNEVRKQFQLVYNGYVNEQSIAYEMVHALFEDHEQNLWVATDNNGLYRFNPATQFFSNVKHLNHLTNTIGRGSPMSFVRTRKGNLLVGTWGDGLYEYDADLNPVTVSIRGLGKDVNPFVWCMVASGDSNTIWMAAQPGIYRVDQANNTYQYNNPALLNNVTITQLAEDHNRNLWLGMHSTGLFRWVGAGAGKNVNEGLQRVSSVPSVQVNKITIDSKGLVWVGTPENGVFVLDPNAANLVARFSDTSLNENRLPERGVSSILEYNDSLVIITTATRVVCYNRVRHNSRLVGAPGMISGFITAVEKDANGFLWLTSTNGLYRINVFKNIFVKFGRDDGIDNEHFTQSASYKLPGGRLLFGTTNDIVVFDPAKIQITPATPDIRITSFKVLGTALPLDSLYNLEEVKLNYQDNSLTIEFSPLIYSSPYLIKYKLDKLDKDWRIADKTNTAIYSFLPPGNYKFLLKAMDEEGKESLKVTSLLISIDPPFWKTWWFYSLVVLAIGAGLFWLDRERTKKKEAIEKMRSDIADDLHEDVNTALSNINILSEMARLKADKDIVKAKEFIQQIHFKSNNMMIALDDMLWNISPENDGMAKNIERFKEHVDSLRNKYGVSISVLVNRSVDKLDLNMKMRQNIFWLLKSGSTNIIRSGARDCHLHLSADKKSFVYSIEFDNTDSDLQQLNNILQRQELTQRLASMNGDLKINMNGSRSEIVVTIPI